MKLCRDCHSYIPPSYEKAKDGYDHKKDHLASQDQLQGRFIHAHCNISMRKISYYDGSKSCE